MFARLLRNPWSFYALLCLPLFGVSIPIGQGSIEYLADPAKYLLEYVGKTSFIFFIVVMAVTPLRRLFPKADFVKALQFRRRQLGVAVFVYALLHFLFYLPYIGSWPALVDDLNKWFILSGMVALVLLAALAATSNNWSVRWLGGKRWKRFHWLTYVALALVMYHQAAQEKTGLRETIVYFSPLVVLEGIRVVLWLKRRRLAQ